MIFQIGILIMILYDLMHDRNLLLSVHLLFILSFALTLIQLIGYCEMRHLQTNMINHPLLVIFAQPLSSQILSEQCYPNAEPTRFCRLCFSREMTSSIAPAPNWITQAWLSSYSRWLMQRVNLCRPLIKSNASDSYAVLANARRGTTHQFDVCPTRRRRSALGENSFPHFLNKRRGLNVNRRCVCRLRSTTRTLAKCLSDMSVHIEYGTSTSDQPLFFNKCQIMAFKKNSMSLNCASSCQKSETKYLFRWK